MNKYVVKGVLVTILLAPTGYVLAKDVNGVIAPEVKTVQVDQKQLVDDQDHQDKVAAEEQDDDHADGNEKKPFWKFWEDDDDEGDNRLSTQHDIKG